MENITFENQGAEALLVYQLGKEEEIDSVAKGMLENNDISGIICPFFTQRNADRFLKYAITSRIPLNEYLFGSAVKKENLMKVLISVAEAVKNAAEYMLGEERLLLDPSKVYVNISSKEAALIYLPVMEFNSGLNLKKMILSLLTSLQFDDRGDLEYVAKIINLLNEKSQPDYGDFLIRLRQIAETDGAKPQGQEKEKKSQPVQEMEGSLSIPGQTPAVPPQPAPVPVNQYSAPPLPQQVTPGPVLPGLVPVKAEEEKGKKKLSIFGKKDKKEKKGQKSDPVPEPVPVPDPLPVNPMPAKPAPIGGLGVQIPGQEPQIFGQGELPGMQIPGMDGQNGGVPGFSPMEQDAGNSRKKGLFGKKEKSTDENSGKKKGLFGRKEKPDSPVKKSGLFGWKKNNDEADPLIPDGRVGVPNGNLMPPPQNLPPQSGYNPGMYNQPPYMQKEVQPVPQKAAPQVPPAAVTTDYELISGDSIIFGSGNSGSGTSTVLLGGGNQGDTELMDEGGSSAEGRGAELRPAKLTRVRMRQTVTINQELFHIGSDAGFADFYISDNKKVSAIHADIVVEGGTYYIVDKNSKNHTFVNDEQVIAGTKIPLSSGDRIRLANEEFEFRIS